MPQYNQYEQKVSSKSTIKDQVSSSPQPALQWHPASGRSLGRAEIMQLQRTMGNRAVLQLLQRMNEPQVESTVASTSPIQENNTGMPDSLKEGLEEMSGMDLSDVRVHYNSKKPSQVDALAYAQGNDIHIAPGQEKHLPHEGWHIIQQRQGRVKPTLQMKTGDLINDDRGLENEANLMGEKAKNGTAVQRQLNKQSTPAPQSTSLNRSSTLTSKNSDMDGPAPIQRTFADAKNLAQTYLPDNPQIAGVTNFSDLEALQIEKNLFTATQWQEIKEALQASSIDQFDSSIIQNILSHLPHRDLVNASKTNKKLNQLANATGVEGSKLTLGELNSEINGSEVIGYHNAKKANTDGLIGDGPDTSKFGLNTPGGQLGSGFYTFPTPAFNKIDGTDGRAVNYGDSSYHKFEVRARGLQEDNIHVRKDSEGTWHSAENEEYNGPNFDAVTDRMDSGGMPELKINDHFYDKESRIKALIKLSDDFDQEQAQESGEDYFDEHQQRAELEEVVNHIDQIKDFWTWEPSTGVQNTLNYNQVEFLERMRGARLQITPIHKPDGSIGKDVLNKINKRSKGLPD
ncbi:hypothetical protein PAECIP111802_02671 [Paenibacillus allorhizosphaerae]|uniref:DUF4157 domain-containing protein n=2 Tax=Paenibacillus allorhizosphaerae TaxID=2849866 RepID=A0ABM8VH41_9BACL|nr:hypothetical protein PAECIP111802_02671 [Paenibacillus allorhizosphaerae]